MSGAVIDLSKEDVNLPERIIIDSNLIIVEYFSEFLTPHLNSADRANQFFQLLDSSDTMGFITSIGLQEIFHFAIRARYQAELRAHRDELARARPEQRRFDWLALYKARPDILQRQSEQLENLRRLLIVSGLNFLQPDDLTPLPASSRLDVELLALVGRYGLDTNDAAMLLEARRAGIMSIATLDSDIRRAAVDFDVYTWTA